MYQRHIFKIIILLLILTGALGSVMAQVRDYAITDIQQSVTPDQSLFTIEVTIENRGELVDAPADINVVWVAGGGRVVATQSIDPIASGDAVTARFTFNTSDFPGGAVQVFRVEVGIDQYEVAGSALARNNTIATSVQIPESGGSNSEAFSNGFANPSAVSEVVTSQQNPDDEATGETSEPTTDTNPNEFLIPGLDLPVVIGDESVTIGDSVIPFAQLLLGGVIVVLAVIVLLATIMMLRAVLRSKPTMHSWKQPYTILAVDPDSATGRRQVWQQLSQNNSILVGCSEGVIHPVKQLVGTHETDIAAWTLSGLRLSQYDMYGRVARSQVIADKGLLKRMNRIVRKRAKSTPIVLRRRLQRQVNPLLKKFGKKLSKKNAMLPVAMDMRFLGLHGEVHIIFELYQCQQGEWHCIDSWSPNLNVNPGTVEENFTYTLHGMQHDEKLRQYKKRLANDITLLLSDVFRYQVPEPKESKQQEKTIKQELPQDTLSHMKPVSEDEIITQQIPKAPSYP